MILPKSKNGGDGEDDSPLDNEEMQKLRSEEQKMKIRLMKSAAMVPVEARIRPLDKRSIDRYVCVLWCVCLLCAIMPVCVASGWSCEDLASIWVATSLLGLCHGSTYELV